MKSPHIFRLFLLIFFNLFVACKKDNQVEISEPGLISKISEIDGFLQQQIDQLQMMSLSAAIVTENKVLWKGSYGFSNKELGKKATSDTPYLIASISKTITGIAAMQLVEQGKLDLDANINAYLPFTFSNPKRPDAVVTCRHLLTHTSGIVDNYLAQVADENLYYIDQDPTLSLADLCKAFFVPGGKFYNSESFTANAPGTKGEYCNIAFALLGYIIERVANQPFDQFTNENIFKPLGMTRTSWRLKDFNLAELAMPYNSDDKPYGHYTFADYPDGGVFTTVNDLSRYLRAFMNGGIIDGKRILSTASVQAMQQFQFPNAEGAEKQGLGWNGDDFGTGRKTMGHLGGEKGANTLMYFLPDTKVGIIVFLNKDFTKQEDAYSQLNIFLNLANVGEKNR